MIVINNNTMAHNYCSSIRILWLTLFFPQPTGKKKRNQKNNLLITDKNYFFNIISSLSLMGIEGEGKGGRSRVSILNAIHKETKNGFISMKKFEVDKNNIFIFF